MAETIHGYAGNILRVDLGKGSVASEAIDEATLRSYVGGTSLGTKFLYDEVPPGTGWSAPGNRLFIGSGPLGGTRVGGSGSISVVTRGALTGGAACTQANGFFGTYLRFSGFDAVVVQGAAPGWVYVYVHDGTAEIRDARAIVGKDTFETEDAIRAELGKKASEASVLSISPAGENLVRFAGICTDRGHMAAHNGVGAVMGAKKLKAIAVERGRSPVALKDPEGVSRMARALRANMLANKFYSNVAAVGTLSGVITGTKSGFIPVRNYTTTIHRMAPEKLETYSPAAMRARFRARWTPCWACASKHCHMWQIPEGKYAGRLVEEPEYEGLAAFSALTGVDDVVTTAVLSNAADRLGMDVNESGWLIAWTMECYEKGILTKRDTDGLEMTWGNGEAIMAALHKLAHREGFGRLLADGVMRAAQQVGGEAVNLAIHSKKGNTPRGHDHRSERWLELFDTCVSGTGTLEAQNIAPFELLGLSPKYDTSDPIAVSTVVARIKVA